MDLSFGNVAGFWALLGIPAVVAIHFLQRRSRVLVVTTLFLLEQMRRESETGHRFQRLRTSVPLWLQLLMVLLLTWLLVRPRWLRAESVQRVAIVLDASASMQASRERALEELARRDGPAVGRGAAHRMDGDDDRARGAGALSWNRPECRRAIRTGVGAVAGLA